MNLVLADTPSMGLLIGGPVALLLALMCVGVIVYGLFFHAGDSYALLSPGWTAIAGSVCLLVVAIGTALAFWPLKHDYHFWVPVEGQVQEIKKRLVPAGDSGGIQERFVVTIAGRPYGVDDTRAALLKPGDILSIRCKREFEWGTPYEAHGWGCKWTDRKERQ